MFIKVFFTVSIGILLLRCTCSECLENSNAVTISIYTLQKEKSDVKTKKYLSTPNHTIIISMFLF